MDHDNNDQTYTPSAADLATVSIVFAFAGMGVYAVAKLAKDWTTDLVKLRNAKKNQKTD